MEINTKDIVSQWKEELRNSLIGESRSPKLAIIVAKDFSEPSYKYINNKIKVADEIGIEAMLIEIEWKNRDNNEILSDLKQVIWELNEDEEVDGVIIQKPFLNFGDSIDNLVYPHKDVDGFTDTQKANLINKNEDTLVPATALGVMKIIKSQFNNLQSKRIVIVNRSNLIGIPLLHLALQENMTPAIIHTKTDAELKMRLLESADIIVTGCGQRKIFSSKNFNNYAVIVDCSMHRVDGIAGVGDCDKEDILENLPSAKIASGYGHTGSTTVCALAYNTIKAYKQNKNREV